MSVSNSDSKYISVAINEARYSELSYRVGCAAVVSGKIVAKGFVIIIVRILKMA